MKHPLIIPLVAASLLVTGPLLAQKNPEPAVGILMVTNDLTLWLDAAQLIDVTNGATVTTWTDMSGNGNHAVLNTGTPTFRTNVLNGRPVVRFPSEKASFDFPRIENIRTVFWVVKKDLRSGLRFLLGDAETYHFHPAGNDGELWDTNASPDITNGTTRLMGAVVDGTATAMPEESFQVLSLVTSGNVQANALSEDRGSYNRSWVGDIAEVLVYTRALSVAEEAAVGLYLATKYGLVTRYTPATILNFGNNVIGSTAVLALPKEGAAMIAWTVPYATDLSKLSPQYALSSGRCTKDVATAYDFRGPVNYDVIDGAITNRYTVAVTKAPASKACEMLTFTPKVSGSRVTVIATGPSTGSIVVNVPSGTSAAQLAALKPALGISPGATCVIPSVPLSLAAPVHYIVTAQDGRTTKDYTATARANAEDFSLFVVKTATNGLASTDYDYLSLIPVSKHVNKGEPTILAIANENDFITNIYFQDYLRRYRPTVIHTINFNAAISNFTSSAIHATAPLELSVAMATRYWRSSAKVVLVSDALDATNYPNVLQASALAAAIDAPMIYYNPAAAKQTLIRNAITQLGATEVIYVNAAGTKPEMAKLVLANPQTIIHYLGDKKLKPDYFATTNPQDLNLISGSKLSLIAPFIAARRNGIVVPITSYTPNTKELFHYTGYPVIKTELEQLYQAIGRYPGFLALVGNATSIPLNYPAPNEHAGECGGSPADLDYAEVDADPFPDIAVGRIMAYDIFDATLLASRISTYEHLFDGVWEKTMADVGGQWNSAYQDVLGANYGFSSTNLIGILGPTQPVQAGIIGHNDHSSYHDVGGAFGLGSVNVLSPAIITSDGCATASIDFETINEYGGLSQDNTDRGSGALVVNQLFKLGAVAFMGSIRSDTGSGKLKHSRAVNALLEGEPLGRCYMAGVDVMTVNGDDDQRRNWILLGDPGFKMHVPSAPAVAPASHRLSEVTANTATLTVDIPAALFTPEVDKTWCSHWGLSYPQYWGEKAGLYGMDVDRFYLVRQTITQPVLSVEELDTWPTVKSWVWGDVKLGMMNLPLIDYRPDGTQQLVWAIRANIMNWPSSGSTVPLASMTSDTFRITYDIVPNITSFNANLAGSSATIQSLSDTNGTVVVYVPQETTDAQIAALAPTYVLDTGATCNQTNTSIPAPPLSTHSAVNYIVSPDARSSQPPKAYSVSVVRTSFTYAPLTDDADSGVDSESSVGQLE